MNKRKMNDQILYLVMTALMLCLVTVATSFIKLPTPVTHGYVHIGDAMIFMSVLLLGRTRGAVASGVGSCLADLLGGYAYFAPWTLIVKFLMAFVMGTFVRSLDKSIDKEHGSKVKVSLIDLVGMVLGGAVMAFGYFIVETVMYGVAPAAIEVPANIGQFAVGIVIALALSAALYRTPARRYFRAHGLK